MPAPLVKHSFRVDYSVGTVFFASTELFTMLLSLASCTPEMLIKSLTTGSRG